MQYEPTEWVDGQEPYLEASNLNKIEQGIVDCKNAINSLSPSGGGDSGELIFETEDSINGSGVGEYDLKKDISNFRFICFIYSNTSDVKQRNIYETKLIPTKIFTDNEFSVILTGYSSSFTQIVFPEPQKIKIERTNTNNLYKIYGIY